MSVTSSSSTPQILCDIIRTTLNFSDDQIWIYNQRRSIPEDKRLYVIVGLISVQAYGNNVHHPVDINGNLTDQITTYVQETISIDLFSYTTASITQYSNIFGSLRSTYSQQIQEQYGIKIAEIPVSINDVSAVEGAALLYRLSITLQVLRKYDILVVNQYYDTFSPVNPVLTSD